MDTRFDGAWARHGQGGRKLVLTDYEGHPLGDRLMTRHGFLAATGVRAGAALFGLASCGGSSAGASTGASGSVTKVTIGHLLSTAQAVAGDQKGFFKDDFAEDGIEAEFSQFPPVRLSSKP